MLKSNRRRAVVTTAVLFATSACGDNPTGARNTALPGDDTALLPLTDALGRSYLGFTGGLYPDGSNGRLIRAFEQSNEDLVTLQDIGLDRLGEKAAPLRERYAGVEHPARVRSLRARRRVSNHR